MTIGLEVINQDITTKDGWEEVVRDTLGRVREGHSEGDPGFVFLTLFVRQHPVTGVPFPFPAMAGIGTKFEGANAEEADACKDSFEIVARAFAILGRACASIFVSEAWIAMSEGPPPPGMRAHNHPNRREVVMVVIHHHEFGEQICVCPITSNADGKRQLGEWEVRGHGAPMGRFNSIVPPQDSLDNEDLRRRAKEVLDIFQNNLHFFEGRHDPANPT